MSKAQKVDDLIDLGFSFDQIVNQETEISQAFIKGRFTKKGLDWKEEKEEIEETPLEKREEASEEAVETEELPTDQTEDAKEADTSVIFETFEDEKERDWSEDEKEAYRIAKEYQEDLDSQPVVRRARTGKYISNVIAALEKGEYHPTELKGINCRFALIAPRPTSINLYKKIYAVQVIMQRLFKKNIRK
jgi:hypothetical protein